MRDVTISISPRRWVTGLAVAVVLVAGASIGASILSFAGIPDPELGHIRDTFVRLTWVDGEANIPAWFSAALLLLCAALLSLVATCHGQLGREVIPWRVLSCIFLLLSLDEVAQLHELSIRPLRDHFHTSGLLYYPWILPAGLGVTTVAVGYSGFLARLPGRTRWLFLGSGTVYVLGALVVEALSGRQAALHGEHTAAYHLIVTLEELLEMAGLVFFVYALLDYLGRWVDWLNVRVSRE